ncbi:hypothetical protein DDE74_14090 [Streptomyces lydicus]|uniref:Major facilitator superfamily (MFS) profile domain-containing protein n=1 Tax=Streptomyces lydicus TaxID=47763 RepID=A0A3S9YAC7_9ACTN|nr:MFS transporter [Streptomyces lydicus]AZS71926.1 hypothetical protein DDE74_14090 [Streptomyces lydicus]
MAAPTGRMVSAGPREGAQGRHARRFIVGIAAIAALGGALFGYDTGVISGALPFMEGHFGLTSLGEGIITSALLIGAAFGSLIGGRMSDALGRRNSLLWAGAVFIGGALAVALAPDVPFMTVARFVLGLAVGSASVITPLYLSEVAPPHIRGRLVSFNSLMIVSGQLLAYLINAFLAQWAAWRWMLGLAALPAVALFVGLFFVPDTPRWYISKGRQDEAARVLRRTLPAEELPAELARIDHARSLEADARRGGRQQLRTPWIRRLLLAEMFPLKVRGLAMGAAVFVMWLVNFGVALVFPLLLDAVGAGTTFWFFGAMCVLSLVFCKRYAPETKGLALEDLEDELRKAAGAAPAAA